jgi:hypothetical protein
MASQAKTNSFGTFLEHTHPDPPGRDYRMNEKTLAELPSEDIVALGISIAARTGPLAEEGDAEDVQEHTAFLRALFKELQRRQGEVTGWGS